MSPLPIIRRAAPEDASTLSQFAAESFWSAYRELDDPDDIASYVAEHFTVEKLRAIILEPTTTTFLATVEDALAGYAILKNSQAPPCVVGPKPIELSRLYLGKGFIGLGVGARLMLAVQAAARSQGAETLWLSVYSRNLHAIRFYEKFGFVKVGTREFLFGGKIYFDPIYATVVPEDGRSDEES